MVLIQQKRASIRLYKVKFNFEFTSLVYCYKCVISLRKKNVFPRKNATKRLGKYFVLLLL